MDRQARLQAVAALDEPTRRRLYEYVAARAEPVGRDEAAAALSLPRTTAAFHLDKLAAEGLLDVALERRSGRTGPGAGRPAKLYRRSEQDIEVTLPERQYAVAGRLLAGAVEDAEADGSSPREALERRAREYGRSLAQTPAGGSPVLRVLEEHGFEPRREGETVALGNCPFRVLAKDHPGLVCTMTLRLVEGLLDSDPGFEARLQPTPGHCCVRLHPTL
ncbi:putative ArsR family transcriptional regulator [Kribbella amoyensis]|uniref:Putative ArsR family transcriptional regulator n=1 Tax=Kribbella amoyensis TaxID=996641 RepID=A0A561BWC5_9ACTN|nr:helix-turn-helix domain-containing protein [Kribbella amoyensis]TWD83190.1 putative ArsR family transcriptional regulator [Kribbella amoyensis]